MRRVISALSAAALLAATLSVVPGVAYAQDVQPAEAATPVSSAPSPEVARTWGVLAALSGREWSGNAQFHRFVWTPQEQRLVWEVRSRSSQSWVENGVFTLNDAGMGVRYLGRDQRLAIGQDGAAAIQFSDLMGGSLTFSRDGDRYRVQVRPIPVHYHLTAVEGWTGASLLEPAPASRPAAPRAPIIVAAAPEPAPAPRSGRSSRNGPAARPAATPIPAPLAEPPVAGRPAGPGPIVIASAPPPPAPAREAPRGAPRADTPRPASANSREAQMLAQVETRRIAAAREAEAARQRQAQIAEQARQAEEARRAQEAANAAAWSEGFGFLAALAGGVAAGMQTGGDLASISGGMAVGASLVAPNSEVAAATNQNFQAEYQRFEEQRAHEAAVIAAMNDPNNPLTQEARRRDEAREARNEAETARIETEAREQREEADREALMQERAAAAQQTEADNQARQEEAEADRQRREQQARRAAEQREREAQQAREAQERRDEEARQRREQAEREAEARRQDQERQRAAAEAERTRVIDFREAVVLCSLSGPQAQFNNWTCEGPLQMTYINFERPNVAAQFNLISCSSYRELPRAGPYRAFGCGYGLHPTNPGASRNVPEMLGVFVDGRITFRCPRNISGVCRDR